MTGLLFDLYRGTTTDGPGIRDTVFFKGCSLHCAWCQNPEGMEQQNRIWFQKESCIGCRTCAAVCPADAVRFEPDEPRIDETACRFCGQCVRNCVTGALRFIAAEWSADQLMQELCKDRKYFDRSGGGVTLSGGEPLMQADFAAEILQRLHAAGIGTALDTCGQIPFSSLQNTLPYTDLLLYDLKIADAGTHKKWTGSDNRKILENADRAAEMICAHPEKEMWIRTPIIPGATDDDENIQQTAAWIREHLRGAVQRWDLCLFNRAAVTKYQAMGKTWEFAPKKLITNARKEELLVLAAASGVPEIHACGITGGE